MKRYLALSSIALILILLFAGHFTVLHAQQPTTTSDQVPSDLSLDLQLAQQNPSPDQQAIVASDTKQVEEITTTGQETVVIPQDTLAPTVKTESTTVIMHPEQTSSEQVVETPVTIEVNDSGTPVPINENQQTTVTPSDTTPTVTGVTVPGTNVLQPDDNAAPTDNSTDSNLPAPTSVDNGISPTPTPNDQNQTSSDTMQPTNNQGQLPTTTQSSDQQGVSPTLTPNDQNQTPSDTMQPTSDQSSPSNDTGATSTTNDTTSTDGSVQGATTAVTPNILQSILQPIKSVFHSVSSFFMRK